MILTLRFCVYFYPRSPCGERRHSFVSSSLITYQHFYPRSPCGERQQPSPIIWVQGEISIHALLAESDLRRPATRARLSNFYPRSPCGERRMTAAFHSHSPIFLSTLSLRRATAAKAITAPATCISIHALLAESDPSGTCGTTERQNFYPRSPCGERPWFSYL